MSYISTSRIGDDVVVWERNNGIRETKTYRSPYYFYIKDPDGEYQSIYGDKLKKFEFSTGREFNEARNLCKSRDIEMFESDIPPELKVLSQHYYNLPAPKLHVSFYDIEVDYNKDIGFSSVANPYAPINSVSFYHQHSDTFTVLAVPPETCPDLTPGPAPESFIQSLSEISEIPDDIRLKVIFCANEQELLELFIEEIDDSDMIVGWNSDLFDTPYVGKRLQRLGGKRLLRKLSFPDAPPPSFREIEFQKHVQETLDLYGRINADYLTLFKKYEMEERHSYKLEAIANEFANDLPKLEYEGTLAELYRKNFPWFIRYNIRDVEILKRFEERLGYVDLANQMYHLSTGTFRDVTGTLKLAELAAINYCHHELGGLIVNDTHVPEESGSIQGAFVLLPQVGLQEYVSSVDIASLYPSAIRSINISPETIIGQLRALKPEPLTPDEVAKVQQAGYYSVSKAEEVKKSPEIYASDLIAKGSDEEIELTLVDGTTLVKPAKEFRSTFLQNRWAVSGYGTVFDQNTQGIIPKILTDWYNQRKKYKAKKKQAEDADDQEKATYYDKLQYVYKIKLNSFYGALTNKYFRFYNLALGESTTATGRKILLHQCAEACRHLDGEYMLPDRVEFEYEVKKGREILSWHYGYSSKYSVVYGDTDSCYFLTHCSSVDQAAAVGNRIGELINSSFQQFMQQTFLCSPGYDDIIQCEREVVSDRGIFVDKKRYILHLVDKDGRRCDKMKVMGLDTKKTTLPAEVSSQLNHFIERYLKGEDWDVIAEDVVKYKDQLMSAPIMTIGLPKGIKGLEEYTMKYKQYGDSQRLPGHVAAAIFYNQCLEQFNDKESLPIMSGMKIKVFYLNRTYGKFKSIAIPVDIEKVPEWFEQHFTVDKQAQITRLVDKPLQNILKAIGKQVPSKQSLLTDDLLVF